MKMSLIARRKDFTKMITSLSGAEMNGHGHDFGHEFVSESVSEADSDRDTRFFGTSDTDSDMESNKVMTSDTETTSDTGMSVKTSDMDSDTRVRSSLVRVCQALQVHPIHILIVS